MSIPHFISSLTLCAFLLIFSSTASAQNLVQNGDFSKDLSSWTVNKVVGTPTEGKICKVEMGSDGSRKSGKIVHITDTDETAGISFSQKIPADAGKSYQLTFASKSASSQPGSPGYATIQFFDKKGSWLNNPEAPGPQGTPTQEELKHIKRDAVPFAQPEKGWKDGLLIATAPADTASATVMFKSSNTSVGEIDIADVVLTQK